MNFLIIRYAPGLGRGPRQTEHDQHTGYAGVALVVFLFLQQ